MKKSIKIKIPHLKYTVFILDKSKAVGITKEYLKTRNACAVRVNNTTATVFIKMPVKQLQFPLLVHELVHVLQYIARDRDMDFIQEQEHFAYIMHYILNQVLGYEFQ